MSDLNNINQEANENNKIEIDSDSSQLSNFDERVKNDDIISSSSDDENGTGLCVVAVLIDFPAFHLGWFVDVDGGLVFLPCLRENLYLRGETSGRAIVVGFHDELL